jgi:hypothetical protein
MKSNHNNMEVERWLDAGLSHYTDVEPRAGLEARILATVRAGHGQIGYGLKPWQLGLTVAAAMVFGATLFLNRTRVISVHPRAVPSASNRPIKTEADSSSNRSIRAANNALHRTHITPRAVMSQPEIRVEDPRLEQFPSPQPLTAQEEMLAQYVRDRRQEALMVARARAAVESREFLSATQQLPSVEPLPDSQQ